METSNCVVSIHLCFFPATKLFISPNLSITFVLKTSLHQQQTLPSSSSLHGTDNLPSQLQFPVLSWMVQTPFPILIALGRELTIFLAVINLRHLVRRHILVFPTIKTVNYTLNYTNEERVEIKRKKKEGMEK
jgi:hypothetical protein